MKSRARSGPSCSGRLSPVFALFVIFFSVPVHAGPPPGSSTTLPGPFSILKDQWTGENQEAFEVHLFSMKKGLLPKGAPLHLSLQETLRFALLNNLDLRAEQFSTKIAATEIEKAQGAFDLYLFSDLSHDFSSVPISSQLQGRDLAYLRNHVTTFDVGLGKPIKTGGRIELSFDLNRFESNSTFMILNPSYASHLNLTFTQPLLRQAGIAFQSAPILIARNRHLISEDQWAEFVTDILVTVSKAYWDLVFAFENLKVRRRSLELAKNLLRDNQTQVELGSMAPIELLQSQTGVSLREEEVITAETLLESAQDNLKGLLQIEEAPTWSFVQILPTETPAAPPSGEPGSLQEAIQLALKNRPEYRAALKELENRNLEIKMAANQLLPALDLTGNIGLNGLGGGAVETTDYGAISEMSPLEQFLILTGLRPPPTTKSPLDGRWKKSFRELADPDSYQWSVGLHLEWPIENTQAKANYMQAKMEAHRALWSLRSVEQKIVLEVKEAWREMRVSRQRIRTSEASMRLAKRQLEAERKRLSLGLSTNYRVLKMEEDLRDAQVNTLKAKVDYWKARAKMLKATGEFLTNQGIPLPGR